MIHLGFFKILQYSGLIYLRYMVKYICYLSMLSSQFLIRLKRLDAKRG